MDGILGRVIDSVWWRRQAEVSRKPPSILSPEQQLPVRSSCRHICGSETVGRRGRAGFDREGRTPILHHKSTTRAAACRPRCYPPAPAQWTSSIGLHGVSDLDDPRLCAAISTPCPDRQSNMVISTCHQHRRPKFPCSLFALGRPPPTAGGGATSGQARPFVPAEARTRLSSAPAALPWASGWLCSCRQRAQITDGCITRGQLTLVHTHHSHRTAQHSLPFPALGNLHLRRQITSFLEEEISRTLTT
jgi:hypothetical protein